MRTYVPPSSYNLTSDKIARTKRIEELDLNFSLNNILHDDVKNVHRNINI